ncbi:MAG: gamma-glutamylcyclotransferase family protein [Christensenellales bacterium]|jgi:gamma-glutamylcyclotransferase (GGCT)/AIG2-like uncharacterized protein YtfP
MKYIAYGSNLNLKQMAMRCPTAKVVGTAMLKDYQLTFRGVATIVPKAGAITPVAVWDIDEMSERALDRYEGYPNLYRKEYVEVECKGNLMKALVYIMNEHSPALPNIRYYEAIQQGYRDVGLDESFLIGAIEDTEQRIKGS